MKLTSSLVFAAAVFVSSTALADGTGTDQAALKARGKYLVKLGGCTECHTPGFAMANGNVPEDTWLIGDATGWHGPWGTTYPINIRAQVSAMTEEQWIALVTTAQARPPMPWYVLHEMDRNDLKAIYAYIRSLGPSTNVVPQYLPPGQTPTGAYFQLVLPPPPAEKNG